MSPFLPRSTPEAEGIPSRAIRDFVAEADATLDSIHSFMVLRHGKVVAEHWWHPYGSGHPHSMFSVSKSVTAMAVGLAIDEGLFGLDDPVVGLLPDDVPEMVGANLESMTVRHLLTMTTGHAVDTVWIPHPPGSNLARNVLGHPVEHEPGSHFVYNSGASYLLSAIIQRSTGGRMLDYLQPRLFEPLGITRATWEASPNGIDLGGWGLSITTEELATLGQFWLQRGQWHGLQLVPSEWVDQATATHIDTTGADHKLDGQQGYGFHFWRNSVGGYRADGAFGQFAIVLPELDAVIVTTAGIQESQDLLDLVWKHLVPAFGADPLPAVSDRGDLGGLTVPPVRGEAAPLESVWGIRWALDDREISQASLHNGSVGIIRGGVELHLAVGDGEWAVNDEARIAASGAWVAPDTYVLVAQLYETPFAQKYTWFFDDDRLTLTVENNVSFDENEQPRKVTGRALEATV